MMVDDPVLIQFLSSKFTSFLCDGSYKQLSTASVFLDINLTVPTCPHGTTFWSTYFNYSSSSSFKGYFPGIVKTCTTMKKR